MKTQVIVDGYNVLKTTAQFAELERTSLEMARAALINWLSVKAQTYDITVVFDAWAAGYGPERAVRERGVRVVYSQQGERADEVIVRLASVARGNGIVVSRDNAVRTQAEAHGCRVATPEALFAPPKRRVPRPTRPADADEEDESGHRDSKKGPSRRPKRQRGPSEWQF